MNKEKIAIIVAGGKGERMQTVLPKQFLEIQGKPILMHTLEVFFNYESSIKIILVLPATQIETWEGLCKKHAFNISHQIVAGGETRFHSVQNGLKSITGSALIAVHDGVRPLVSSSTIGNCFDAAATYDAAIPVVDLVDSIRQTNDNTSISVDRNAFKLVQTPQIFDSKLLEKAYKQEYSPLFTDDASVIEALGVNVRLVEGNRENIKITTSLDLQFAALLLKK